MELSWNLIMDENYPKRIKASIPHELKSNEDADFGDELPLFPANHNQHPFHLTGNGKPS